MAIPGDRGPAALALAQFLGAADAMVLVEDIELGVFLPALGFRQTLPGFARYQALIEQATSLGMAFGELTAPNGDAAKALCIRDGAAIFLFGVDAIDTCGELRSLLPLLGRVYGPEREQMALMGHLAVISDAASDVQSLATQLDLSRKELEQRVRERTEELQFALKEAESFNYSISHDLRTPLRAIVSTASILLEEAGPTLAENYRYLLRRQAFNANRLANLIDQLLELSRLGRVAVRRTRLDMTATARAVAIELGVACDIQEGMEGEGDAALVRTVYQNLIGNSIKFSPSGMVPKLGEASGTFWVQDEGIGFNMVHAAKVFLPFERLVLESDYPGTGIGLANVERIVKRHGGKVWVESQPGQGATFFFTLGPRVA